MRYEHAAARTTSVAGKDLKRLRLGLGVTVAQFADLMGFGLSTLYNVEDDPDRGLAVREHQRRLLDLLEAHAGRPKALRHVGDLLRLRGPLFAQYVLMQSAFGDLPKAQRIARVELARAAS